MNSDVQLATRSGDGAGDMVPAQDAGPAPAPNPLLVIHGLLRGRYPWAILLAVLGLGIGAPAGYLLVRPEYRSVGVIRVQPILPRILYQTEQNSIMPMFDAFLASQVAQLQSRRVVNEAMLQPEWKALGRGLLPEAVADFEEHLEIVNPRGSPLMQVSFSDPDPKAAATAVKAIINSYEHLYADSEKENGAPTISALESRRRDLTIELNSINERILAIANDFGSTSLQEVYEFKLSELNKMESQVRYAEMQQVLSGGSRSPSTQPGTAPSTQSSPQPASQLASEAASQPADDAYVLLALNDQRLQQLQVQRDAADRELRKLLLRFGESHANVVDARNSLKILEEDVHRREAELREIAAMPRVRPAALSSGELTADQQRAGLEALRQLYADLKKETVELGRKNLEIEKLRTDAADVRERLAETKTRLEQLNVEKSVSGRLSVISYGDIPLNPDKDRRKAISAAAGLGLAGLGVGSILLLGLLDRRVQHIDRSRLRHIDRLLGVLPDMDADEASPEQAAITAYCIHHIRAMLQIRQRSGGRKIFGVTSPAPGDGKTTLVITLGMSLAESGCRTLLVDCDFDGGGLSSRLRRALRRSAEPAGNASPERCGIRESPGIVGVLRGEPLEGAVVPTGYHGLSILPLGVLPDSQKGQFSPDALRRLLDQIAPSYDTVLLDSGPILGSVEAAIVAAEVDGMILVVSRGGNRPQAERAANLLISTGAEIEGIVFNRADAGDVSTSVYHSSASARSSRGEPTRSGESRDGGVDLHAPEPDEAAT